MIIKKEADIVLMIVFIVLFFGLGSYIDLKEQKGEKIIDIREAIWEAQPGAKEIVPKPKKPIEEKPAEIIEIEEPEEETIEILDTKYSPNSLKIKVGTTVTWINKDPRRNYRVYEKGAPQLFNSRQLEPETSFSYTFTSKGKYHFSDGIFVFMSGTIVVE